MKWLTSLFARDKQGAVSPQQLAEGSDLAKARDFFIQSASVMVQQINESLQLVDKSHEAATRVSRLAFAKQRLADLKGLVAAHPYVQLVRLDDVESSIKMLELRELQYGYRIAAEGNERGKALEAEDAIDLAITQYESLVTLGVDTPFTYRRLAILYRKLKRVDDEFRTLQAALRNIPEANASHYAWFADRLSKMKSTGD